MKNNAIIIRTDKCNGLTTEITLEQTIQCYKEYWDEKPRRVDFEDLNIEQTLLEGTEIYCDHYSYKPKPSHNKYRYRVSIFGGQMHGETHYTHTIQDAEILSLGSEHYEIVDTITNTLITY